MQRLVVLARTAVLAAAFLFIAVPVRAQTPTQAPPASYYDHSGYPDAFSGGVKMIPITTPDGTFRVWTKRVGNNPRIKVLLLHGGPGMTHEYLEAFDSYFPGAGIQYYYYDQLGSFYSDQPEDTKLWTLPRFVDEVEQVRKALGLNRDNFYLYGHSWGGILALEYALKYPQHLKGLIISNMMASAPAYDAYAHKVLMPQMDPKALAEILKLEKAGKTHDPKYMDLLMSHFYVKHVLRMPPQQWPDPVMRALKHANETIYTLMQGPSEMGLSGRLEHWDVRPRLKDIAVPTLTIGARYGTMDPKAMQRMAERVQHGRYLYCPHGSHLAMYDDQKIYMDGVIRFIEDVDAGRFPAKTP
ncbi:proline-specific peptidase family protein [Oleiagrimonas citrea]|uniref:Proline iminopeptidase-family hydrolase n=1 Tax=Oleiagrimonas citrea TaxID=1665687 RepID=A0A846ZP96_9GAMM|nr:proline iminopeptidase-family hydrolase [Oleiagrimonas citrea]NKZ40044.1 proline iminopeptidase-family hydrolase [Oleiagrimonas citrea]